MTATTSDKPHIGAAANAKPFLYGPELAAIEQVLNDGQYGHSHITDAFERELADFCQRSRNVPVGA